MPTDAQGRTYYEYTDASGRRQRSYVSNGQRPADSGGIFKSGWQWDAREGRWKNPIDWSNIANIAIPTVMTAGLASGGASGGLLPNAFQTPANLPWYAGGAGMNSALGVIAPTTAAAALAGGGVPGATGAPALGGITPTPNPTSGGNNGNNNNPTSGGMPDWLKDVLEGAGPLAALLPLLSNQQGGGGSPDPFGNNPQLKSLMDMSVNRAQRTDPLHEAVTTLAMSRLPTNVQR